MTIDQSLPEGTDVSSKESPFDYIIVGSGAGGGPLASRLANAGKKVLLLEAGRDPAEVRSREFPLAEAGEIHQCPGYHGASTEDAEMSWQFSVRHFADQATQAKDEKYDQLNQSSINPANLSSPSATFPPIARFLDQAGNNGRKGGIFYPRAAAVGGCTAHHAMIIVAPNARDWNYIADLTGDESWRAERMHGYFAKIEKCLYLKEYDGFLRKLLGPVARLWFWISEKIDPRGALDQGGHGTKGWQPTSFTDPLLVQNIAKSDKKFFDVLVKTSLTVLEGRLSPLRYLKEAVIRLRIASFVDPNDLNTRRNHPEGVFLIPTGISGGTRAGVRELLGQTQGTHPNHLVILQGVHVTRVLFEMGEDDVPIAIGVEYAVGDHLYEASPLQRQVGSEALRKCFAKSEVILCGGSFNTPQLLMLSGIGDTDALQKIDGLSGLSAFDGHSLKKRNSGENYGFINLPGVGKNLQDRYEVTVVSEVAEEFSTLDGVSFTPGDPNDHSRKQWMREKKGLYASNGGALAIIRRSRQAVANGDQEPDLFTFGAPAAFRGYYWGWSRELLRPFIGAPEDMRRLWSWVILKAYTSNDGGSVRLRDASPFTQPEICFDSFNEAARAGNRLPQSVAASDRDIAALEDAIAFTRRINKAQPDTFVREIQPGSSKSDHSDELREWIKTQAWGHHACGTCRIGADSHRPQLEQLLDRNAVLDSRFRVHGVHGLRVVDASIFPKIPGYFIVTPIFMASEKAADTILSDANTEVYPAAFEKLETAAIHHRRNIALPVNAQSPENDKLPKDTVGLALSGGGIRSATFSLGLLQALAEKDLLRHIDFLSTVSGGGFIGSFLGRLFTRSGATTQPPGSHAATDPCGKVQDVLKDDNSGAMWWLRNHANYILDAGAEDVRMNLAVFWRNIFTIHAVVGALAFVVFGIAALFSQQLPALPLEGISLVISAWWWLPLAILVIALLPLTVGYWLAPLASSYRPYPFYSLLAWLVLLAGAVGLLLLPYGGIAAAGLVILTISWIIQEIVRWEPEQTNEREPDQKIPNGGKATLVLNRLTRALGVVLLFFGLSVGWVILDTLARSAASLGMAPTLAGVMLLLSPALPVLKWLGNKALQTSGKKSSGGFTLASAKLIGIPIALFLLFIVDVLAHTQALKDPIWCVGTIVVLTAFSAAIGRSFDFLNRSSLHTAYAARLTRTFQGASNEARIHGSSAASGRNVELSHPDDDVPHHSYHPEREGGPLHLINVCINDTVDFASDRAVPERKALPMCVGPYGVSVGRRYFATWTAPDLFPKWQKRRRLLDGLDAEDELPISKRKSTALRPINLPGDPETFHVLASKESESAEVEPLTLGTWTAISGAAFTTGAGRQTHPGLALLLGLANIRLGYWWDSGIQAGERPGRYPSGLWRSIKRIPVNAFRMQSLLLSEWQGRFHGAARWFWYLSDGGHFENTGLYELIRRRLPLMILADAGQDALYQWEDLAQLERQARIDFGADIRWITPIRGKPDWAAIDSAATALPPVHKQKPEPPPAEVKAWIDPTAIGSLEEISGDPTATGYHAALARVSYAVGNEISWLLVIKPSLTRNLPLDIRNYATLNPPFPQQPTLDQVFDDAQWESHRSLGKEIGHIVFNKDHTLSS